MLEPIPAASGPTRPPQDLILATKLYIPDAHLRGRGVVARPRLLERLSRGLAGPLVLVSAPAGFGKTTLLAQAISGFELQRPAHKPIIAWLSLDVGDNDGLAFLSYVVAALQTAVPGLGRAALEMGHTTPLESLEPALTLLVNELCTLPGELVLVLDDYHVVDAPAVHGAVTFLVDRLPGQAHLVIATRADPPLPLARWRSRGQMVEIRANDLRFTHAETSAFLNQVMGLGLAEGDVSRLEARTEGWVAGLQMAALSMQGRSDPDRFIQTFSGSHRYILDYLLDEVLSRQPEDIQSFLLRTSILERLSGPLCDTVLELEPAGQAQAILEHLETANLFLVPLDDDRRWYRYHHLFVELLRSRLNAVSPDQVAALNRRAGEWYAANGLLAEAIGHALAGDDVGRVIQWVEGNSLAAMEHGELARLAGWLDVLTRRTGYARPQLCIAQAWALVYIGQLESTEPLLEKAGMAPAGDPAESRQIQGHIAAIRGYIAALKGNLDPSIELARQALDLLPAGDRDAAARGSAADLLAHQLKEKGDLPGAVQAYTEALACLEASSDIRQSVGVLCDLALIRALQGQLHQAAGLFEQALQRADEVSLRDGLRLPEAALAYLGMSNVLREWNNLEGAVRYAREGLALAEQWGKADVLIYCYRVAARVFQTAGDGAAAGHAIRKAVALAQALSPWYGSLPAAEEAVLHVQQGDRAAAARWVQASGLHGQDVVSFQNLTLYHSLAYILVALGRPEETLPLLDRLEAAADRAGATGLQIRVLVCETLAFQALGRMAQARESLARCLTLAEPGGHIRSFVDQGVPMAALLQVQRTIGSSAYVDKLLAAFVAEGIGPLPPAAPLPLSYLPEPLSERELEVLRLIAAGRSNREIAETLVLALGTVKAHLHNIYGKLDAETRTQAIARARELKLL